MKTDYHVKVGVRRRPGVSPPIGEGLPDNAVDGRTILYDAKTAPERSYGAGNWDGRMQKPISQLGKLVWSGVGSTSAVEG
jgi:hypothetical protein